MYNETNLYNLLNKLKSQIEFLLDAIALSEHGMLSTSDIGPKLVERSKNEHMM
jgi:hypothetical protein